MKYSQSEQINELATALSKFQGEIASIQKNCTVSIPTKNGKFNFNYADLADIWNAIRKPLSDNGLSLVQPVTQIDNRPGLLTQLMHSSGQWVRSEVAFDTQSQDIKQFGANVTYYRRYCLTSTLGIVSEDDVDAALSDDDRKEVKSKHLPKGSKAIPIDNTAAFINDWSKTYPKDMLVKFLTARSDFFKKPTSETVAELSENIESFKKEFEKWMKNKSSQEANHG